MLPTSLGVPRCGDARRPGLWAASNWPVRGAASVARLLRQANLRALHPSGQKLTLTEEAISVAHIAVRVHFVVR
jgi:hypothetical protein